MNDEQKNIINTIKLLAIDMIDAANSGHPGIALGAAPILYTLYANHLRFDPKNPNKIFAADEGKSSIEEAVEEQLDALDEDFSYAMAGLEKLQRDGEFQQALAIIDMMSNAVNDAIAQIGDNVGEDSVEE